MKNRVLNRIIFAAIAVLLIICCVKGLKRHEAILMEVAQEEGAIESDYVSPDLITSVKTGFEQTFLDPEQRGELFNGLFVTISLVAISLLVGSVVGSILFLLGYNEKSPASKILPVVGLMNDLLPVTTLVIIVFYVFIAGGGWNTFIPAAIGFSIAFSINFYGCLCDAYEEISSGEKDAAATMGYSPYLALRKVFLPGMLPSLFESLKDEIIDHINDTTMVGLIGVFDLQMVSDIIAEETGEPFFPLLFTSLLFVLMNFLCCKGLDSLSFNYKIEKSEEEIRDRIGRGIF